MKTFKTYKNFLVLYRDKFCKVVKIWFKSNWRYFTVILLALGVLHFTKRYSKVNLKSDMNAETKDKIQDEDKFVSLSIASMEPLLKIEQSMIQALNDHANQLQYKVDEIRRGISTMRKPTSIYHINEEEFLSNPLNSFPMLRRLKHEWKAWEKYIKTSVKSEFIEIIENGRLKVNDFDLSLTVDGVQRLRDIYDIQPQDWTDGKLRSIEYETPFTALDCYAVAFLLYKQEKYESADEWYEAALKSYKHQTINKYLGFNRSTIFESYAENLLKQNRTALALMMVKTGLKSDPDNFKLAAKKSYIESLDMAVMMHTKTQKAESKMSESIKRGCRGDYMYNTTSKLNCYYNWTTNDFVRLAPFKVEKIYADPIILLYHDIVADDEIDHMKSISKDNLKRSFVRDDNTTDEYSSVRTSKSNWIDDDQTDMTTDINQRIEDMTGLSPWGTSLHVGNYGLGGHYSQHLDCLLICDDYSKMSNCDARLMTVLIYSTNVENGGSTIFPNLEVAVPPQKGVALVWYNLRGDMIECDQRTLHMACPVIVGSKWILIKWIYLKDQMFRKPCYK